MQLLREIVRIANKADVYANKELNEYIRVTASSKPKITPFKCLSHGCTWLYLMSYVFNQHQQAENLFNEYFRLRQMQLTRQRNYEPYSFQLRSFESYLYYAMFLFNVKSKKGCKYFEYCLSIRPTNGYSHYIYSMYLYKIINDYRLSYYHLKMAKILDSNMIELNHKVEVKVKNSYIDHDNKQNITQYQKYEIIVH